MTPLRTVAQCRHHCRLTAKESMFWFLAAAGLAWVSSECSRFPQDQNMEIRINALASTPGQDTGVELELVCRHWTVAAHCSSGMVQMQTTRFYVTKTRFFFFLNHILKWTVLDQEHNRNWRHWRQRLIACYEDSTLVCHYEWDLTWILNWLGTWSRTIVNNIMTI